MERDYREIVYQSKQRATACLSGLISKKSTPGEMASCLGDLDKNYYKLITCLEKQVLQRNIVIERLMDEIAELQEE